MLAAGKNIRITGNVQGVGFRPFVWQLAQRYEVAGHVLNDRGGVVIEAFGPPKALEHFVESLTQNPPRLARIDAVEITDGVFRTGTKGFQILHSTDGGRGTGILADAATCAPCLVETRDSSDRRFGYPFTNCTQCGPRFSIVRGVPYDRQTTSMSEFGLCEACLAEYENPADRRFHAQPIACPDCGPALWYEDLQGTQIFQDPIDVAAENLKSGKIIAVKGVGGFQIAIDAGHTEAISALRRAKQRPDKPLALMARDLLQIRDYCHVCDGEAELLASAAAPILLLAKKENIPADEIAPGQDRLGFMLPNTPLHHLLMARLDRPIVLTSANVSGNPQETANAEARVRLKKLAAGFLMHNREIENQVDDSVMRLDHCGPAVLRRARGLAPSSIFCSGLPGTGPKVLAMGGELKNTFCLLNGREAVVSQHTGDLNNSRTFAQYKDTLCKYLELYDFKPDVIAVDMHPQYLSSRYGRELAGELGAELVEVQHHHAHLASCLGEDEIAMTSGEEVFAATLDGSGWGADKSVWGGEILRGNMSVCERLGGFKPVRLPGGDAAAREPWRNLLAQLHSAFGAGFTSRIKNPELRSLVEGKHSNVMAKMLQGHANSPLTSSAGRFFDAVAAALQICFHKQSFEGQAAMQLECLARPYVDGETGYDVRCENGRWLEFEPLWAAFLDDLEWGLPHGRIAARVHLGVIEAISQALMNLTGGIPGTVVLSGGVFQNAILRDGVQARCSAEGFRVLTQRRLPANDGGLAFGQALVAATRSARPDQRKNSLSS